MEDSVLDRLGETLVGREREMFKLLLPALDSGRTMLADTGDFPPLTITCPQLLDDLTIPLEAFTPETAVRMAVILLLYAESQL